MRKTQDRTSLRGVQLGLPGTLRVMANANDVRFPAIEPHDILFLRKDPDVNILREPAFALPNLSQHENAKLTHGEGEGSCGI